jgi:hypothetical protein
MVGRDNHADDQPDDDPERYLPTAHPFIMADDAGRSDDGIHSAIVLQSSPGRVDTAS